MLLLRASALSVPEAPVQWDLLVEKNVVQASFWTVLCYYGNVGHLHTSANEFTQVGMIELPAGAGGVSMFRRSTSTCLPYLTCLTSCRMLLDSEKVLA